MRRTVSILSSEGMGVTMGPNQVLMNTGTIGAVVLILSFIAYVMVPNSMFIATFILGLALLLVGYSYLTLGIKSATNRTESLFRQKEEEGYIISLDGDYAACEDGAEIISLETDRCQP